MMKLAKKWMGLFLSAALLVCAAPATAKAAEVQAPFGADQLIAVVNAQSANVRSAHTVIAENIQMTDAATGMTVVGNLTLDTVQNQVASHTATNITMSTEGFEASSSTENYTLLNNNVLALYEKNPATGAWQVASVPVSPLQIASMNNLVGINGIDTTGSVVMTDGSKFRFAGVISAAGMNSLTSGLDEMGINTQGAFPVIVEVDAATLLPTSMTIALNGFTMADMPGVSASVVAVVTYDGYNQFDAFMVPADVIRTAAAR